YIKMEGAGNPNFQNENPYNEMIFPDAGFRLLAVYRYWNMIQYFFPYKYQTDKDWNDVLKEYIPIFLSVENRLEYELASIQCIGEVCDTHAGLYDGRGAIEESWGKYYAPFRVAFIEKKLVVVDYYNPEYKDTIGLEIGDIITHINSESIEDIVERQRKYYPASNELARLRRMALNMVRSTKDTINITLIGNDARIIPITKNIQLYESSSLDIYDLFHWYGIDDSGKSYRHIDDDIGYITLASIQNEEIPIIREEFLDKKGIIIDIRNYPTSFMPFILGSYFVSEPTTFVKVTIGSINNPGEFSFRESAEIPDTGETFQGKLIVIVNEISQSQAEWTAMAFRAGNNTTIIGSTTAGADGNVSEIYLPGGLETCISGIGVYYPDGTQTQRIGIVPDIWIEPTIEGIRQGRDELLEKAIELINGDNNE
ncbi:MAG: S41 family peptidase, partial [Candidatus Cloacimonetes bacterium]|nr:S41 family peptidase [Candidatus Cloacimonadota bacterium]